MRPDGCQGMASIRGTSRGSHPSLPPLLIPQEETLAPSRGPPIEIREAMAGWRSNPRSGRGWPLCQEPLSQKRGVHPSPRALVVRQGLPLSMDTRHFVQGWPGIPLFPGLDLPHTPTGPWLGLPSWPSAPPLPLLAGAGIPAGFPSIFHPTCDIQLPSPATGKLSRLGWSPLE